MGLFFKGLREKMFCRFCLFIWEQKDCEDFQGCVGVGSDLGLWGWGGGGCYLQSYFLRVLVWLQVLQEVQGFFLVVLFFLILNCDVQFGYFWGVGWDVDVIGYGLGDGRDYYNDDGDGDYENGGC